MVIGGAFTLYLLINTFFITTGRSKYMIMIEYEDQKV